MGKKTNSRHTIHSSPESRSSAGYMTRARLVMTTIAFLVITSGLSVYALTTYHEKLVTITDIPSIQIPGGDQLKAHSTTKTDTSSSSQPASPAVAVTPASSSDVPSLTPTSTQSSSAASYESTNWAGYLVNGGNFTAMTGTWGASNPSATSTTTDSGDGTWIGIGGVTTSDLIQIGTQNTISPSGIVSTSGFYELLPARAIVITSVKITPGDTISASITETSKDQWTLSLTNVTTGRTFSTVVSYSSSYSSAEWIQEDPSYPTGGLVPLDNFGLIQFTNATSTMNGTTMSAAANGASPITLIGQGSAIGHTGVPYGLDGSSFLVQYR